MVNVVSAVPEPRCGGRVSPVPDVSAGRQSRRRVRSRPGVVAAVLLLVASGVAACSGTTTSAPTSPSGSPSSQGIPSAPSVTSTEIKVGAIATRTGVGAGDFAAFIPGMQAYFDMVNAQGGINGRKLVLADNLDDGGNPTTFAQLAHTLLQQDRSFAAFVSTFWFSPNLFTQTGTPTYGYNVSNNWAGPDNLFAAGGSIQDYHALAPPVAYLAHRIHAASVAVISYGPGIPGSYPACHSLADDLTKAGIDVSYTGLDASLGGEYTSAVQQMRAHQSDFVVSCLEGTDNVTLARAIQQYGLNVHQLWLNGYNQSLLDQYRSLMQGVYVDANGFVPFSAAISFPGAYPGLQRYLAAMRTYAPASVTSQLAMQGWQSAALFAEGVKRAGADLTQQNVIAQTNRITDFTAGGITALVDWTHLHTTQTYPVCPSFVQVKGDQFLPALGHGHQVFVCFAKQVNLKNPVLVAPPPGTPGS
jgi:branched-chain amino acid transport system substrate-binding protein